MVALEVLFSIALMKTAMLADTFESKENITYQIGCLKMFK